MDTSEVEFISEKESISIVPNFSLDKIYLIGVSLFIICLLFCSHSVDSVSE